MTLTERLLAEILGDAHRYAPGPAQSRPTLLPGRSRRRIDVARERAGELVDRARDGTERLAARAGFARRHFDAAEAGRRLARVLELAPGLEETYAALTDEPSRRALIDVLKLRVLGPYHVTLATSPAAYRARQRDAERRLCVTSGTFEVSDPWFSPLSLYRVSAPGGEPITLHSHSVDIVSVFGLGQYAYARGGLRVAVRPGDVVLDVGGCWGDTALLFAAQTGPGGKVYTFEFDPENLAILRANLALNPELAARIEVVERPLWDRSGQRLDFVGAGRMSAVLPEAAAGAAAAVQTLSLDDFRRDAGLERVDFVKLDVEGAEPRVLAGASATLAELAPRLALAAYHRDDDLVELPRALRRARAGYRFCLASYSPLEDETVLFATAENSST